MKKLHTPSAHSMWSKKSKHAYEKGTIVCEEVPSVAGQFEGESYTVGAGGWTREHDRSGGSHGMESVRDGSWSSMA